MVTIRLSPAERRAVKRQGYAITELPDSGIPQATYHDPKTGQEFPKLPSDPRNIVHYLSRGLMVGPAPVELRKQWEEASKHRVGPEQAYIKEADKMLEEAGAVNNETVERLEAEVAELKAGINQLLQAMGVKPQEVLKLTKAPEAEAVPVEPIKPRQLRML